MSMEKAWAVKGSSWATAEAWRVLRSRAAGGVEGGLEGLAVLEAGGSRGRRGG